MMRQAQVSPRDLRSHGREILDAVEDGQSFIVTRDGREVGELVPLQQRRRFVPRADFAAMSVGVGGTNPERFRHEQDAYLDPYVDDPYER